jgi:hypothetical protein
MPGYAQGLWRFLLNAPSHIGFAAHDLTSNPRLAEMLYKVGWTAGALIWASYAYCIVMYFAWDWTDRLLAKSLSGKKLGDFKHLSCHGLPGKMRLRNRKFS